MPLCTLHLLFLHPTTPNPLHTFLSTLKTTTLSPLVISRVIRWIILPSQISTEHLLARNIKWDVLLVLQGNPDLPEQLANLVEHHWWIGAGVPSRLVQDFAQKNKQLLHPSSAPTPASHPDNSPKQTTQSSQNLELSAGLDAWIKEFVGQGSKGSKGAVSMLNLLAFKDGMKEEYLKYGAAFAKSIGSRHGGNAKIVGNVVSPSSSPPSKTSSSSLSKTPASSISTTSTSADASQDGWNEIALAHYPSILHFRDMLVSEDYQAVNQAHRVPSLKDTCILMTSEIGIGELVGGGKSML